MLFGDARVTRWHVFLLSSHRRLHSHAFLLRNKHEPGIGNPKPKLICAMATKQRTEAKEEEAAAAKQTSRVEITGAKHPRTRFTIGSYFWFGTRKKGWKRMKLARNGHVYRISTEADMLGEARTTAKKSNHWRAKETKDSSVARTFVDSRVKTLRKQKVFNSPRRHLSLAWIIYEPEFLSHGSRLGLSWCNFEIWN